MLRPRTLHPDPKKRTTGQTQHVTTLPSYLGNVFQRAPGTTPSRGRMQLIMQVGCPLGALVHAIWAVMFWYLDIPVLAIWNLLSALTFAVLAVKVQHPRILKLGIFIAVTEIPAHAFLATVQVGSDTLFWAYALTPIILVMGMDYWPRWGRAAVSVALLMALILVLIQVLNSGPVHDITSTWTAMFILTNGIGAVAQLVLIFTAFDISVGNTEAALQREHDRADGLLKNILPDPIALRLKDGEHLIADDHAEVSVLFADIVNFTEASAKLRPAELVETLNLVFTEFDLLAEKHGAEKIKTIGDAYMAVVGVPNSEENHATVAVHLALDMLDAARRISAQTHFPIDLRIGVNSGPVVAGVIGKNKFAYDLWGDAVNVAARMESHSEPGKIMLTDETRRLLGHAVSTRDEGKQDIKGKGLTQIWSLAGPAQTKALHS